MALHNSGLLLGIVLVTMTPFVTSLWENYITVIKWPCDQNWPIRRLSYTFGVIKTIVQQFLAVWKRILCIWGLNCACMHNPREVWVGVGAQSIFHGWEWQFLLLFESHASPVKNLNGNGKRCVMSLDSLDKRFDWIWDIDYIYRGFGTRW